MRRSVIAIGLVGLVGLGVWVGRSSSEATTPKVTATEVSVEPAPIARPRIAAAPVLPKLRPTLPGRGLAADLVASDPKVRLAAVREVVRSPDADVSSLLVASRDPDPAIAGTAIGALGKLYVDGQVSTADMVARAADRSGGSRVRGLALNALGGVPHPDAAKLYGELARSSDVGERRAATALLGSQSPEDAIPLLILALSDQDEYVRDNAVNGLRALSRGRDFGTDASAWQAWWQAGR